MLNCAIILIIIIGNIFLECDLSWLTICKGKYDFFLNCCTHMTQNLQQQRGLY